jgi:hypothetical protein
MEYGLSSPRRIEPRRNRKMDEKQVHGMAAAKEWVCASHRVGGWEDRGGVWVVFININDMYNNDVGKGGVRVDEAYEVQ